MPFSPAPPVFRSIDVVAKTAGVAGSLKVNPVEESNADKFSAAPSDLTMKSVVDWSDGLVVIGELPPRVVDVVSEDVTIVTAWDAAVRPMADATANSEHFISLRELG